MFEVCWFGLVEFGSVELAPSPPVFSGSGLPSGARISALFVGFSNVPRPPLLDVHAVNATIIDSNKPERKK